PRFRFPPELARRGVDDGKVIVEIDILPDGRARLRRIISSTHPELEPVARQIVEAARFTKPEVDGRPQTVRGRFPLILQNDLNP
ncbi:MAG: TonB family protein, partial [Verrucomicrobiota bacterium]